MARNSAFLRFSISGIEPFIRQLEEVGNAAPAIAQRALKAATEPMVEAAKALAPKRYGALRKSIGLRARNYGNGIVVCVFGPRNEYVEVRNGKRIRPAKYAHIVEFGAAPHRLFGGTINATTPIQRQRRRDVLYAAAKAEGRKTHPGAKAQPFMRPAWDANQAQILPTMSRVISEGILEHVKKNGG